MTSRGSSLLAGDTIGDGDGGGTVADTGCGGCCCCGGSGGGGGGGADGCGGVIGDTFCSLHGSDVLLEFVKLLLKFATTLLELIVCVAISTYRTQPFPSAPD